MIYFILYGVGAILLISTNFIDIIRYSLIIIACFIGTFAIFFVTGEVIYIYTLDSMFI